MQIQQGIGSFERFSFEIPNERKDAIEAVYALLNALKIKSSQAKDDESLMREKRKRTSKKIFGALSNVSATDEEIEEAKAFMGLK